MSPEPKTPESAAGAPAEQARVATESSGSSVAQSSAEQLSELWLERYGKLGAAELTKRAAELEAKIFEATKDELEKRFELGLAYELRRDGVYSGENFDPHAIAWVRILPDGRVLRIALPPEEFPEAHAWKAEAVWLAQRAHQSP